MRIRRGEHWVVHRNELVKNEIKKWRPGSGPCRLRKVFIPKF